VIIPKQVRFPFNYHVKVKRVTPAELAIATHDPDPGYAAWDVDSMTIYLDRTRPLKKLRADFLHEMEHAFADWRAFVLNSKLVDPRD